MSNNWIEHVKAYSKKNNITYKQALKDAKPSYKAPKMDEPPKKVKASKKSKPVKVEV